MLSIFKSIELDNGYSIVQPPAGLIPAVNTRLKLYTDENGSLTHNVWAAIFVLACLHKDGKPVIGEVAQQSIGTQESNESDFSIRFMFTNAIDEDFKTVVEEFLFSIDRDTLETLFNTVDSSCYITKKATDTAKND